MPTSQFVRFNNLTQIVAAFCGSQRAIRIRMIDRDSEGFSGAVVLRVTVEGASGAADSEYCLRGWPPESLPRERLLGLHRLLEHVHRSGVKQVAVPLRNQFGTTMYTEASQFWQLEPWMPGRADFSADPNDERLRNALRTLAQWHSAATHFVAHSLEADWFRQCSSESSPTVLDRLERIHRFRASDVAALRHSLHEAVALEAWPDSQFSELRQLAGQTLDFFELAVPKVWDELLPYRDLRLRLHPCLRDIWHDHVLFTGNEVTGIIDPSAARTETSATDVARLLGSLLGDDVERWDSAVAAYREVRPFSDREFRLARVLDRTTVLLSGLTWLERLFVQRLSDANPARVLARLRQIIGRLERLVHSTQPH